MIETRICSKCKEEKSLENEFYFLKRCNRWTTICRKCRNTKRQMLWRNRTEEEKKKHAEKVHEKYIANPSYHEKYKVANISNEDRLVRNERTRSNRIKNKASTLVSSVKKRAKAENMEFNITPEDIQIPEHCPVLGILIVVDNKKREYNSPSVDRIDSSKGYVKGNVRVISWRANMIKSIGNAEEHRKIADYIDECMGQKNEA